MHHHVRVVAVGWTRRDSFEHHPQSLVDGTTFDAAPAAMRQQPGKITRKVRSETFNEREPGGIVVVTPTEGEEPVRPYRGRDGHDVRRMAVRVEFTADSAS